jgi:predicted RNA-binding Zn-ribbon protein involved in translation (DUF1610 family)
MELRSLSPVFAERSVTRMHSSHPEDEGTPNTESREFPVTPPLSRQRSFAESTGQARRLWAAYIFLGLSTVVMVVGWWRISEPEGILLLVAGLGIFIAAHVAQCVAVRCPRCGTAVVWYTFTTRKPSEANLAALRQVSCPRCGYTPD